MSKKKGGLAGANLCNMGDLINPALNLPKYVDGKRQIHLPEDWSACERGNVWIFAPQTEGDKHLAYLKLPFDLDMWLEVSIVPENWPGLNVKVVTLTEPQLAAHINGCVPCYCPLSRAF
jgi:hypothetical protein